MLVASLLGEIFDLIGTLLWIGLILAVIAVARGLLVARAAPEASAGARDVDLSFAAAELDRACDVDARPHVAHDRRAHVLERARREHAMLEGARALWAEPRPGRIRAEAQTLQALGFVVGGVATAEEARAALADERYDVLVAGDGALSLVGGTGDVPLILYVDDGEAGTPPGAFALTNRPDELLHLTIDALERHRLPPANGPSLSLPHPPRPTRDRFERFLVRLRGGRS